MPEAHQTAAAYATARVPTVAPGAGVAEVRSALRGQRFESVSAIAVLDGTRLVGLVRPEALWSAADDASIASIMDADPPVVRPGLDQERAAWKAVQHGEAAVPVVDEAGAFVGLIPAHRMLQVLLEERNEDLARRSGELLAVQAAEEPVLRRLAHRLPWLILGLAAAMGAAGVVGTFEAELEQRVALAFFLPAVIYIADAVGTQTETLIIRGLSAGVPLRRVASSETLTGALVGVLLAGGAFVTALAGWGDREVALTLAVGIAAACSVATLIAMVLPEILTRVGVDPAFGSGPIATVAQDVLTIVIYLSAARVILG